LLAFRPPAKMGLYFLIFRLALWVSLIILLPSLILGRSK
jgi:hypothetical protein